MVWSFKTAAKTAVKIKNESKQFLPLLSKMILFLRYLLVFLVRVVSVVSYFAPFLGLWDILNHHQAETIPLDYDTFKLINETDDQKYHYWNPISNQFDAKEISIIFRSNYEDPKDIKPPPSTLYTGITLKTAFIMFWTSYLIYGIVLAILKSLLSKDFKSATKLKKLQHIVEALNLPESFSDWDTDLSVGIRQLQEKWSKVLCEMLMMVGLQFLTNMALLIPFFITGRH